MNELNEFKWDNPSEVDFFGEVTETNVLEKEQEKLNFNNEDNEVEKSTEVVEIEKEVEEENVFSELEKGEEDKKEVEETVKEEAEKSASTNLKHLFDNGILSLDEDEELPEEIDDEYIKGKIEESVDKGVEDTIKNLPKKLKDIIKYVSNGGDLESVLDKVSQMNEIPDNLDMDSEKNQEAVLRIMMEEDGEDEDYIDSHVQFLKDSGRLEAIAKKKYDKYQSEKEQHLESIAKNQEKAKLAEKERQKQYKKEVHEFINENETVKGINLNKNDFETLPKYISDLSIKLEDGRQITPFYKDLFEALKDKSKVVALAKILKDDFNFTGIKKEVITKQTEKLKQDLQRQKTKTVEKQRSSQRRLIDLLDE